MSDTSEILLTESHARLLEKAMEIFMEPPERGQIGFIGRSLIQATLPHSNPKVDRFVRTAGRYTLTVTAMDPDVGLPYGKYPRLILVWICTEARRTEKIELVLGRSLSDFMGQLGLIPTGGRWGTITALKDQMNRLLSCAFYLRYVDGHAEAKMNLTLATYADLLWEPKHPGKRGLFDSTLTLNPAFFAEIMAHPVPIDMRALEALKTSSLAIDIYQWMTWRVSYLKEPIPLRWEQLAAQFGSNYADNAQGIRDFKRDFLTQLRKVSLVYQGLDWDVVDGQLLLRPSPTHVPRIGG